VAPVELARSEPARSTRLYEGDAEEERGEGEVGKGGEREGDGERRGEKTRTYEIRDTFSASRSVAASCDFWVSCESGRRWEENELATSEKGGEKKASSR